MAIEIKELRIKVTIHEETNHNQQNHPINTTKWNELRADLIRECTQIVFEKIKERQER